MAISFTFTVFLAVALLVVVLLGYLLRLLILPKPYPGIPYHRRSANRVLSDIPHLLDWKKGNPDREFDTWSWISEQNAELNSPVIQLLVRPAGKPFVIVTDHREATDVLIKRNQEFHRSSSFRNLFGLLIPRSFVHGKTGGPHWPQRKMIANIMSNSFLNTVAAALYIRENSQHPWLVEREEPTCSWISLFSEGKHLQNHIRHNVGGNILI